VCLLLIAAGIDLVAIKPFNASHRIIARRYGEIERLGRVVRQPDLDGEVLRRVAGQTIGEKTGCWHLSHRRAQLHDGARRRPADEQSSLDQCTATRHTRRQVGLSGGPASQAENGHDKGQEPWRQRAQSHTGGQSPAHRRFSPYPIRLSAAAAST